MRLSVVNDKVWRFGLSDVGHLLGSASIEIWMKEDGVCQEDRIFRRYRQLQQAARSADPQLHPTEADYAVMESTYGGSVPPEGTGDHVAELARVIVQETLDRGGNVVIPAFAVGTNPGSCLYYIRHDQGAEPL